MTKKQVSELIGQLEAEVNNGGFDQFFFNSAGDRTEETISALEAMGAKRTSAIIRRATAKFPNGVVPTDRNKRQDALEKVSPDGDSFEKEDNDFLRYEDDLEQLLKDYK